MQGKKLLDSIRLKNLLSYGSRGETLELEPLNVLIGPNASGKSNLIEAISLLAAAPKDLTKPIREGGGVAEWIWKGDTGSIAELEVSLGDPEGLRYVLAFIDAEWRLEIVGEILEDRDFPSEDTDYYTFFEGQARIKVRVPGVEAHKEAYQVKKDVLLDQSGLSQFKGDAYPELTYTSNQFSRISFFRERNFGRHSAVRKPQRVDLPDDFLLEDASNLGLVLNKMRNRPATKRLVLEKLRLFYEDIEDFETQVQGGTIQVFIHEKGDRTIPAARLSDGTLQFLCLLAILCHPEPPPLICIEEPELGLHPDIIPKVAELLADAARRTQLIVTTHSDSLVAALSEIPEAVVVCERDDKGTRLRRLEPAQLTEWLDRYSLGQLWSMGEIGGNRW